MAREPRGTPSGFVVADHCPPTACKLTVSGSFSLPFRGTFHLSLTVLVLYRSLCVFSLGKWSPQLHTVLACTVLLRCQVGVRPISSTGLSPSSADFPKSFHYISPFFTFVPDPTTPLRITPYRFGLLPFRSPLLWEYSLFLRVLRCFSSPGSLPVCILFHTE